MIKPILFSTPMVQAILDGRKTMTRRVIKPSAVDCFVIGEHGELLGSFDGESDAYPTIDDSPYQPGDILWVRETWTLEKGERVQDWKYVYRADDEMPCYGIQSWRPSIFMPKSAARIWLRVTDVRVERVQDITNNDAIKEGCPGAGCDCLHLGRSWMGCESCMNTGWQEPPVVEFAQLWQTLNAKRGYGWDVNPWVWVISFERCEKPGEAET